MRGLPEEAFPQGFPVDGVAIRGTEVAYYAVCPRKCWLFQRRMEQEHGSDLVLLGRLTDEASYQRERPRSADIEGFVRLDFTAGGIVHEVKHGPAMRRAHRLQVGYYLHVLRERGVDTAGILHYPRQRRREQVLLTPELEKELRAVLAGINRLRQDTLPPPRLKNNRVCRSCAYEEFCWAGAGEPLEEGGESR